MLNSPRLNVNIYIYIYIHYLLFIILAFVSLLFIMVLVVSLEESLWTGFSEALWYTLSSFPEELTAVSGLSGEGDD